MTITDSNGTKTTSIKFDISKITDKTPVFEDTPVQGGTNNHIKLISNTLNFYLNSSYSNGFANDEMYLHLCFWRDNNIYYQWIGSNNSHLRASGSE
ncbi:hypothetical protein [Spiroplasma endosymbiont of Amphimallon solstitiale]|uniref:hypothetical protein n=1 Tax=Spiroplasma endosymbiont of Amphimallon solstitiale TaxID=3066288 RepID=UPI00313ED2C2